MMLSLHLMLEPETSREKKMSVKQEQEKLKHMKMS